MNTWPDFAGMEEIPSPALLIDWERVEANLRRMLEMARDPGRLWPHLKTHKLPQLIRRQVELGILRSKCATIAEAEMAAEAGSKEVLLAQQPVGVNVERLWRLVELFPQTRFLTIADAPEVIAALAAAAGRRGMRIPVLLDLDVGMGRTGVRPHRRAAELYRQIAAAPALEAAGLHAYDGHLQQPDPEERARACAAAFGPVRALRAGLEAQGLKVPRVVAGGTPTFACHAAEEDMECSPGTGVLWDAGYGAKFPDLGFQAAALLLTRVISKPGAGRLCLDLGHKAVASEMPPPRAVFPALPDARAVLHSEEHLVIETAGADRYPIGAALYAIPWHICPTVALHGEAWVIKGGQCVDRWPIVARARRLRV